MILPEENDLLFKVTTYLCQELWQCEFTRNRQQENQLNMPQRLSMLLFLSVKFCRGVVVAIYCKNNGLLPKDCLCCFGLWRCVKRNCVSEMFSAQE